MAGLSGGHAHLSSTSIISNELLLVLIVQANQVTPIQSSCNDGLRHAGGGRNKVTQTLGHQWQKENKQRLHSQSEGSRWSSEEQN